MPSHPQSSMNSAARETNHQVVIDLSDLTFVPGTELSVLIKTLLRVQKCVVKIGLSGLQDNVRRIFEIEKLDRIFPIALKQDGHKSIPAPSLRAKWRDPERL
jgi:anti-anti-sigma factor